MNRQFTQESDEEVIPDLNEQYLLYQTLVGTWPVDPVSADQDTTYSDRIVQYMQKALREAKIHTSWLNPSEPYEAAVTAFIQNVLSERGAEFQADLAAFVGRIADTGFVTSLAQLLLKMTLPGVPDFYQGTELWGFNLVDPDNRRPVDFTQRRERLDNLLAKARQGTEAVVAGLIASWPDPDVKLWITSRTLAQRREWPDVFCFGEYVPLSSSGTATDHVLAFARHCRGQCAVTAVPRHFHSLAVRQHNGKHGIPRADWKDTRLGLPDEFKGPWRDVLTGRLHEPQHEEGQAWLEVKNLFAQFPVALLISNTN
jgi:(1->4)-alpha-D-glucan 1-alpha-D-glucosylmutase